MGTISGVSLSDRVVDRLAIWQEWCRDGADVSPDIYQAMASRLVDAVIELRNAIISNEMVLSDDRGEMWDADRAAEQSGVDERLHSILDIGEVLEGGQTSG